MSTSGRSADASLRDIEHQGGESRRGHHDGDKPRNALDCPYDPGGESSCPFDRVGAKPVNDERRQKGEQPYGTSQCVDKQGVGCMSKRRSLLAHQCPVQHVKPVIDSYESKGNQKVGQVMGSGSGHITTLARQAPA